MKRDRNLRAAGIIRSKAMLRNLLENIPRGLNIKAQIQREADLNRLLGYSRSTRRATARMARKHGRGYTKPVQGRAHTRGSGRG